MKDMYCKNCNICKHSYQKDIAYDEYNPEYVVICGIDNRYIGYSDEVEKEVCEKYSR